MGNYVNKHLGENLKDLREKNCMKQSEASVLFGMIQQNYSKLECGKKIFSDDILNSICNVFNITPNEFLNYRSKVTELKENENVRTDKDLIAQLEWRVKMQYLRIADLEIEVRKYRRNFIVGNDGPPVHVLI